MSSQAPQRNIKRHDRKQNEWKGWQLANGIATADVTVTLQIFVAQVSSQHRAHIIAVILPQNRIMSMAQLSFRLNKPALAFA